jgi:hypothetical protein
MRDDLLENVHDRVRTACVGRRSSFLSIYPFIVAGQTSGNVMESLLDTVRA